MKDELKEGWKIVRRKVREMGFSPSMSSINLRRVNAYLVQRSPFSFLFWGLGVTSGREINRAFAHTPSEAFFEGLRRMYYSFVLSWIAPDLFPTPGVYSPLSLWELDGKGWECVLGKAAEVFAQSRKRAFFHFCVSRGDGKIYEKVKRCCRWEFNKRKEFTDEEVLDSLLNLSPELGPPLGLILLARGMQDEPEAKRFFVERRETNRQEMVRNAYWRYLLGRVLGGISLTASELLTGLSLHELNLEAEVFQRQLESVMRAIVRWELVPIGSHFSEAQAEAREAVRNHRKMLSMGKYKILTAGAASGSTIPDEVKALADRLAEVHGQVLFTVESGGRHLYIPDPELLETDGEKELYSRHMAINADKYLGLGKWDVKIYPTEENKRIYARYRKWGKEVPCCMSMKTGRKTTVAALLSCAPIEKRVNFSRPVERKVVTGDGMTDKNLVYDEEGNLVPEAPGEMVPLSGLEQDHPAILYLRRRGYDPLRLERIYGLSYCVHALPEDRSVGRYYSRIAPGVLNWPQGRIIIPIRDVKGVQRGWQARLVDMTDTSGDRWIWGGDAWRRVTQGGECVLGEDAEKKIRKYLNARGMQRNGCLFGVKEAVESQKEVAYSKRVVYLMEGALDVAKGEPPCVALLGKSMSDYQAEVVLNNFGRAILVCDNDRAGKDFLRCVRRKLESMEVSVAHLPPGLKDLGDCSYEEAAKCLRKDAENAS